MRFEVEKDGQKFEVEAADLATAMRGLSQFTGGTNQEQAAPPPEEEEASLGGFVRNVATDIGDLAGGAYQAIRHPIETGQAIAENPYALAEPYVEMAQDPLGYAYERPVSSLLNVSVGSGVLGLGAKAGKAGLAAKSAAAARAKAIPARSPGAVETALGKVGDVALTTSRYTDPFTAAVKGAGKFATGAGRLTSSALGATTTAGSGSVSAAAEAGFKGGSAAKAFKENISGKVQPEQMLEHAQAAVGNIYRSKKGVYNREMASIYADTTPRSFATIDAALDSASQIGRTPIKGGKSYSFLPGNTKVVGDMRKVVTKWKKRGAKFHTIGDFNDMKRELGELVSKYEIGTPQRTAASEIYNSVKKSIIDIEPRYAKIMEDADAAQTLIRDVKDSLSLKDKAMKETGIRKLQTALRDTSPNAAGLRRNLVQALVDNGAENLVYEIAGSNLNVLVRPGLAAQMGSGIAFGGVLTGAINPAMILGLVTLSPRIVGKGAYRAGQAARVVKPMIIAEKAMRNKLGITGGQVGRGASLLSASAGRLVKAQERSEELKTALNEEAAKLGYNIHPRVMSSIVDKLLSDDPAVYMNGIEYLRTHKRIRDIFEAAGTKGER